MSIATHLALTQTSKSTKQYSVAIIGLGGGGLCSFLRQFLPQAHITAVDIDQDMLQVAKDWFGLVLDANMQVQIVDGTEFLKNNVETGNKFDAILFDIDSKDNTVGMSCPPKEFLQSDILEAVQKSLNDKGLFVLNLVLRDTTLRPSIVNDVKKVFQHITSYKLSEDLNEIFICGNRTVQKKELEIAAHDINRFFKKNNNNDNLCVLSEFVNSIQIL